MRGETVGRIEGDGRRVLVLWLLWAVLVALLLAAGLIVFAPPVPHSGGGKADAGARSHAPATGMTPLHAR
jgi:hypothetical protein